MIYLVTVLALLLGLAWAWERSAHRKTQEHLDASRSTVLRMSSDAARRLVVEKAKEAEYKLKLEEVRTTVLQATKESQLMWGEAKRSFDTLLTSPAEGFFKALRLVSIPPDEEMVVMARYPIVEPLYLRPTGEPAPEDEIGLLHASNVAVKVSVGVGMPDYTGGFLRQLDPDIQHLVAHWLLVQASTMIVSNAWSQGGLELPPEWPAHHNLGRDR